MPYLAQYLTPETCFSAMVASFDRAAGSKLGMELLRTLGMLFLAYACAPAMAHETNNPFESATFGTTIFPFIIIGGTTALTVWGPSTLKSAKLDALAYIGSGGEIRGAQFEQAVRYYHSAFNQPYMTDEQLALAIATSL
ncbi:DUF2388 domain-containing protein [Pseudomonas sp. 137P]|uniref:DUF2388 domain-containing protein n=2 Tax=Pseudomonas carassii TaxID=3115855 RepID=A0ABU7HC69_9PSED|nr:DUF2388 domain-containing protein [Pseudomonas mosselii]MEE1888873.1 DUF2388 domain-containing protein [Pseudomonas sp. 137P]